MATPELIERDPRDVADEILNAAHGDHRWLDAFAAALDRQRGSDQLAHVLAVWGLSQAEAARLFGVTRQAVGKWLAAGVPHERVEAVADLAAASDLLVRYLRRERIPAVVRREAEGLGMRSLVEVVAEDGARAGLEACRAMFAFDAAQA